jgi:hypothetical protein
VLISGQLISSPTATYWDSLGCGFHVDLFSFTFVLTNTDQQMNNDELDGAYSMCGNNVKCIKDFAWKTWEEETGRPSHRWENSIKVAVKEMEFEHWYWVYSICKFI